MLSNWLANFALDKSLAWMQRNFAAEKAGETAMAARSLRKAENWDDVRLWIDGYGSWRQLRAARRATREIGQRRSRPLAIVDLEGVAS